MDESASEGCCSDAEWEKLISPGRRKITGCKAKAKPRPGAPPKAMYSCWGHGKGMGKNQMPMPMMMMDPLTAYKVMKPFLKRFGGWGPPSMNMGKFCCQ